MALTFLQLFTPKVLTTSAATIYTLPASPTTNFIGNGRIRFTNVTAGAITVNAWAIPAAGSAADGNAFMKTESIPANSHVDVDLPQMIAGDFIQALASAGTSITVHAISGIIYS